MAGMIGIIGFGEAAQAFTGDPQWRPATVGYDVKLLQVDERVTVLERFQQLGVGAQPSNAEATRQASAIISLVTADQVLAAATETAQHLPKNTLYLDMNSVAPNRKRACAEVIARAGGRYVDVAIMAPVHPPRLSVPLLVSGPDAAKAEKMLSEIGFSNIRIVGAQVGDASTVKMVRSVMIKGIEALTAECFLAADAAGVTKDVLESLGGDWPDRANYNLDRMLVHGKRRAAEMEEVCATLTSVGIDPILTRGTVTRQNALGSLNQGPTPETIDDKLALMRTQKKASAA